MCMWSPKSLIMHLFLLYYAQFSVNSILELNEKQKLSLGSFGNVGCEDGQALIGFQ